MTVYQLKLFMGRIYGEKDHMESENGEDILDK